MNAFRWPSTVRALAAAVAGELKELPVDAGTYLENHVLLHASGERYHDSGCVRLTAHKQFCYGSCVGMVYLAKPFYIS